MEATEKLWEKAELVQVFEGTSGIDVKKVRIIPLLLADRPLTIGRRKSSLQGTILRLVSLRTCWGASSMGQEELLIRAQKCSQKTTSTSTAVLSIPTLEYA